MSTIFIIIKNSFLNTFLILGSLLGVIVLEGLLLGILRNLSVKYLMRTFGYGSIVLTGLGTFVHEIGHMVMALIFTHKIKDFKLFPSFNRTNDGTLGYVNHSYNEKNIYQQIGCFFIGIGPLISGTVTILFSMYFLFPKGFQIISKEFVFLQNYQSLGLDFFSNQLIISGELIKEIFTLSNLSNISFWIFIFITFSVSLHISLSKADLQGASRGVFAILVVLFILNLILSLLNFNLKFTFLNLALYNGYMFIFLNISLVFSILGLILCFIFNKLFKRR